ncbi:MAG: quinolinate synthase NadA [Candidatus Cloacimonetes bacterium]|nr:quinolinate synthase NadA [Candidatus Cloacimonadota bacterium]
MDSIKTYEKIETLKKEKSAIVLAHNYVSLEVQRAADIVGDSFQLAKAAKEVAAELIIFCGVRFMAETAKLLNPGVKVILASSKAGCPMADMVKVEDLQAFKAKNPKHIVVCYVNSSVEVKAYSDVCVTSSNAVQIVQKLPFDSPILFIPDQNLGFYVSQKVGRPIELWQGFCPIHHRGISPSDVRNAKEKYPSYQIIVHPECTPQVVEHADFVGSTKQLIDYASEHDQLVIGTELNMIKMLQAKYPAKKILPLSEKAICTDMGLTTLDDVLVALETEAEETVVSAEVSEKALQAINRMLEMSL